MPHEMPFVDEFPLGLISTVPRSGTWYNHYLFGIYNRLLLGQPFEYTPASNFDVMRGLQLNLSIMHTKCPGFFEEYSGPLLEAWTKLGGGPPEWSEPLVQENLRWFSPRLNPDIRIVFVFRNPMDHSLSVYAHLQNHADPERGKLIHGHTPKTFFLNHTVRHYIRRYFTYEQMKAVFPKNIMMLPYEIMMRDRIATFRKVLHFLDRSPTNEVAESCLLRSIESTSAEQLKKLEKKTGRSLAGDQAGEAQTHIRSGAIGTWRQVLDEETVGQARRRFMDFGIDLDEFICD